MASDPLAGLIQSIQEATTIPSPAPYSPDNSDPIFRLINKNEKPNPTNQANTRSNSNAELSERTRQAISNRPLQGKARLEAADLALDAIENPSKERIEKILEILISG